MTFLPFLLNRSRLHWLIQSFSLLACNTSISQKKKYLFMYIDKQNQLKKKKNNFFLFWPVTLQQLNGSSTVLVSTQQCYPMTFLRFLLNRSRLPICSCKFFLYFGL